MTLDENKDLKYNKKNIVSNSKNEDSINSNLDNLISENFDEKLYDEVEYISNALNEGSLDLTPDEESKLKKDLDLILSNIEKQNQKYDNSEKIGEEKHITINESKDLDFEDSIFINDDNIDSSPNSFEDNFLLEDNEFVSMDGVNDSIFENSNNSQNLGNNVIKESVESEGIVVDDVEESVESEGIVVDDVEESVEYVEESVESEGIVVDDVEESVESEGIVVDNVNKPTSVDDALNDLMDDYSNEIVIKVNNVSMEYKLSQDKIDTLKEFFIRTIKRNKGKTKTINALKNISFEIPKGDRVGIIGFNGAGKSTLLKLLSRVYDPTEGTIETKGKIAPLLSLGAGFDQNYTGKANIFLNGAFLGYSEDFIKEKYDEIVEFSELGDAINYHVKTYSSGMWAKLGFSIATIVEPDILIIDEILAVGDIKFKRKSSDKIRSLINSGITVLLVSHSVSQIRELCNKAIWIDDGELKMMGEVNKVCDAYVKAANDASQEQLKDIDLN